jgi:Cytochrome c3/Class III cytochrome C family
MRTLFRVSLFSVVLVLMAGAAGAEQSVKPPANDDCLACHGDPSAKRANGSSVAFDETIQKAFAKSKHADVACVDCHQDLAALKEFPHPDSLAKVSCGTCHDTAQEKYTKGVHAQARRNGGMLAAACIDCHGKHDIQGAAEPSSPTNHQNLPGLCAKCHGNQDIIDRGHIQIGNVAAKYHDSIHGKALEKSGLVVAPSCVDCHGNHDIARKADAASPVFRGNIPATCGKCHTGIKQQYDAGVHASALKKGDSRAPVCADCHSAHAIQRADTDSWRVGVAAECGSCHAEVVESFKLTFHGKVTELGFSRVAACADCHGAHEILPASNPASLVSPGKLVATCGKCHSNASASFVKYDPHPNPGNYQRGRVLWWANRFYWALIPACFGFFGLHSLLWFWRSRKNGGRS